MEDVLRNLLEQQTNLARQFTEQQQQLNLQISAQNENIEQQQHAFNQMMNQIKEIRVHQGKQTPYVFPSSGDGDKDLDEMPNYILIGNKGSEASNKKAELENSTRSMLFNSRIEFPQFDGVNPRGWVKKCSNYFNLCKTPSQHKVELASLYLIGKAETWYSGYALGRQAILWEDFVVDVCARFGDELGSHVVEEFNKLKQTGPIEDYLEKFEELKSLMLIKNPSLPNDYFVDSFIGGLDDNIKHFAKAFNPKTLPEAVKYARLQEATIQALKIPEKPKHFTPQKVPSHKALLLTPNSTGFKANPTHTPNTQIKPRILTSAERAEKLAKGLCFFCD